MSTEIWLVYAGLHFLVCLIPGPMALVVIAEGLTGGLRRSLATVCGILIVNSTYLALAASGAGTLLSAAPFAFQMLRWLGIGYMAWLAWQLFNAVPPKDFNLDARKLSRSFAKGLIIQFTNPGALFFFLAIVPQFIDPQHPTGVQFLVLGLTSILIEAIVLIGYGSGTARIAVMARQPHIFRLFNRTASLLLATAAIWSLLTR